MINSQAMFRVLDGIVQHLRRLDRRVPELLQRGLTRPEIQALEATLPFSFTEELVIVYEWRNGTKSESGDILDELNFFPGFYFPPLQEAIEIFHERKNAPQWREGWFPLFADGAGDFYIIPCAQEPQDAAEVIGFLHGEPQQIAEYESIMSMVLTLNAAYAENAFYLDADDTLEIDDSRYHLIANRFNPGIPEWQSRP
jgi:cell wall assembly regulator SMI1